jgi:hypothetical protein
LSVNYTYFDSQFSDIDTLFTTVNREIRQLTEFEEESIYLITDSVTQAQEKYMEARQQMDAGDTEGAVKSLKESVEYLTAAGVDVEEVKLAAEKELNPNEMNWFMRMLDMLFGWI